MTTFWGTRNAEASLRRFLALALALGDKTFFGSDVDAEGDDTKSQGYITTPGLSLSAATYSPRSYTQTSATMSRLPPVIMDNGTGYTKIGYSGNNEPSFVFPTAIATRETHVSTTGGSSLPSKPSFLSSNLASKRGIEDLDFFIGEEAIQNSKTYTLNYPIRHGQIENWDHMERFWEQSIFKYLRCEPEDHYFVLVSTGRLELLSLKIFVPCREAPTNAQP